jgi:hypothetical protein
MPNNDKTIQFTIGVAQVAKSQIDVRILENLPGGNYCAISYIAGSR